MNNSETDNKNLSLSPENISGPLPSDFQIPPPESGEEFEQMCLDLYEEEFKESLVQRNGRRGQAQDGVDIFVEDQNIGIQCKEKDLIRGKITEKELTDEVEKAKNFKPTLKKFILVTTCKRDAKIQEKARLLSEGHRKQNLFSIEIHSWDEIKELFDKYSDIFQKYYGNLCRQQIPKENIQTLSNSISIKSIKSDSHHSELNRIRDIIDTKPKTAFELLEKFKKEKWNSLDDKAKYRILTNMGCAKIRMNETVEASELFIKALQFNEKDEDANSRCAIACFINRDIESSKKYIKKVKDLNPLNALVCTIEIRIKDKEQKSLEEIINDIPELLRKDKDIAYILAHINVRKKQYEEASKWMKILYENENDDANIMSRYAELSLTIISEREDVKTSIRTPEELKDEIKRILKIYKKLTTENQYSETKQFNPNWYINYAIAFELDGQIDKGEQIIRNAIEDFPDNNEFKVKLSGLLMQQGKLNKSISLMEEIQERTPEWDLFLAGLYFDNSEPEKAKETLKEVIQNDLVKENYKIEAKIFLISILTILKENEEAENILTSLSSKVEDYIFLALKSKIEENKGSINKKIELLKKASDSIQKKEVPVQNILELSVGLYNSRLYGECEPLFEKITNYNLNHPEIFKLLYCYFENGKNKEAIKLAENLIEKFPNKEGSIYVLFHLYEELGDRQKAIEYCEKFVDNNPDNNREKVDLCFLYIKNGQIEKAKKLLDNFNLTDLSVDQRKTLSMFYYETGDIVRALENQYQLIKKNPSREDLQRGYFLLSNTQEAHNKISSQPKEIGLNCYIKLRDTETQEEKEVIIEDQADIFTPDHGFSKKLMGEKTGNKVQINNESYEILEIKSKYVYKYQCIVKNFGTNFPSNTFMKKFTIPKKPTSEELLQSLKEVMSDNTPSNENIDNLFQFYKEGKISIGFVANILKKHPFIVLNFLVTSNDHKFISLISEDQNQPLKDKTDLIIDLSSLAKIHWAGMEKEMEKSNFDLYVCQSTIDSLKEFIKEMENHPKEGFLLFNPEEKTNPFIPIAHENIKQDLDFLRKMEKWVNDYCQIKPLPDSFIMKREDKLEIQKILGKEFLDPFLATHNQKNTLVLSEDGILKNLLKNEVRIPKSHFPRVRLLDVINHFKQKNIIDENRTVQLTAELVKLNQIYIPVNDKVLIFLLKEAQYSINDIGFQRALFFLGPISDLNSIVEVISEFLITLYQKPISFFQKKTIMEEVFKKVFYGRKENPNYIIRKLVRSIQSKTILQPIVQNEIYRDVKNFVKSSLFIT